MRSFDAMTQQPVDTARNRQRLIRIAVNRLLAADPQAIDDMVATVTTGAPLHLQSPIDTKKTETATLDPTSRTITQRDAISALSHRRAHLLQRITERRSAGSVDDSTNFDAREARALERALVILEAFAWNDPQKVPAAGSRALVDRSASGITLAVYGPPFRDVCTGDELPDVRRWMPLPSR